MCAPSTASVNPAAVAGRLFRRAAGPWYYSFSRLNSHLLPETLPMRHAAALFTLWLLTAAPALADDKPVIQSAKSGAWSAPRTWAGKAVPGAGARVLIRRRPRRHLRREVGRRDPRRSTSPARWRSTDREGHGAQRRPHQDPARRRVQRGRLRLRRPPAEARRRRSPRPALVVGTPEQPDRRRQDRRSSACTTSRAWTRSRARPSSAAAGAWTSTARR